MTRWEHACVSLRGDSSAVWSDVLIWAEESTTQKFSDYEGRNRAICQLGNQGFELVTVTEDVENDDGVWGRYMRFKRPVVAQHIHGE